MPHFEVTPEDDRNPFSAVVATRYDYKDGMVRIEPPFTPGESTIDDWGAGHSISFFGVVSGPEATILGFEVSSDDTLSGTNEQRVRDSVTSIIGELGFLASKELFIEENS